jgi:hypothetical protein
MFITMQEKDNKNVTETEKQINGTKKQVDRNIKTIGRMKSLKK